MSNTTPEVPATPAITDMGFAINQIAEANNQIRAKETTIEGLASKESELQKSIQALEVNKKNLEEENNRKHEEGKTIGARKEEMMGVQKENMAIETAKLEKLREEVAEEVAQLAKEKAEVEAGRGEADRIRLENEKVSAELESKIVEAKRLSGGREASLEAIKLEKAAVDTELKKTQLLKDETTAEAERNREILEKIEEAQKSAAETFDTVRAEREENERIKAIAQAEVGSADFIKNEAHRLVMIFRQALQTYISVNGSTIKIPELTIEDLKFVAKDLISQIPDFDFFAEFPEAFADKDTSGTAPTEVNWDKLTKPQLVIEGREKFGLEMSMELTQKDMVATLVDAKNKAITE